MTSLATFLPNAPQIAGLGALLAIAAGLAVLGGGLAGANRLAGADLFVGWGVAGWLLIVVGTVSRIPLGWVLAFIGIAVAASAVRLWARRQQGAAPQNVMDPARAWRPALLAIPMLLLVCAMQASQWDEFSQWLPNAQYLLRQDAFPRTDLPPTPSVLPGYPYGLPLVVYAASRLAGHFVENAGAVFNLLLLLAYVPILLKVAESGLESGTRWFRSWGAAALGVLGVTLLCPTFVPKIVLTAYADSATSVVLAVLAVLLWSGLNALADEPTAEGRARARGLFWQGAWVTAIFLSLKQTNLVLLALLLLGVALVAILDRRIRFADFLRLGPILLVPGVIVLLAWRVHVARHMPGGEFAFLPFSEWLIPEAFRILSRMLRIASNKGGYFVMMTILAGYAGRALFGIRSPFDRLAVITATVFLGYNLFLWFTYVSAFGPVEGLGAASYWRYNTQLGLLGTTCAALGLALLWRRFVASRDVPSRRVARAVFGLLLLVAVLGPVVAQSKLRFDIRPQKTFAREVGRETAALLPEAARIGLFDPRGNGMTDMMLRYELTHPAGPSRSPEIFTRAHLGVLKPSEPEQRAEALEALRLTHAWLHEPHPELERLFGTVLTPAASTLLVRRGEQWTIERVWPYPGYADPFVLPD